ncbi:hypothetical protein V6N11_055184 [Hibiscus sabdariffa]|uniref:Uncharacterized protein n=1 Tax=Hibiscus sabdariffa TaxID=183260 RepID=A0ABR2PEI4_9ROSI
MWLFGNGCLSSFYFYLLALLTILTLFSGCAKEQKVCAKCRCRVDQIVERQLKMLERGIEERYYVFPFRAYMVANFALGLAPQEERKNNLLNALK